MLFIFLLPLIETNKEKGLEKDLSFEYCAQLTS